MLLIAGTNGPFSPQRAQGTRSVFRAPQQFNRAIIHFLMSRYARRPGAYAPARHKKKRSLLCEDIAVIEIRSVSSVASVVKKVVCSESPQKKQATNAGDEPIRAPVSSPPLRRYPQHLLIKR